MKIVIDISEEEYTWIKRASRQTTPLDRFCVKAIANGIPLPEQHGRLIDYECVVDAIDDWINAREYSYTNATYYLRKRVKDIPTIIEGGDSE